MINDIIVTTGLCNPMLQLKSETETVNVSVGVA